MISKSVDENSTFDDAPAIVSMTTCLHGKRCPHLDGPGGRRPICSKVEAPVFDLDKCSLSLWAKQQPKLSAVTITEQASAGLGKKTGKISPSFIGTPDTLAKEHGGTSGKNCQKSDDADGWTPSELDRKAEAESGRACVANINTDTRLIEWAKKNKLYSYIGRGSKWGNKNRITKDRDRAMACLMYAEGFGRFHETDELKGCVLGCYCHPLECHGDLLTALANEPAPETGRKAETLTT